MSHKVGDYRGGERPFDAELERLEWLARALNPDTQRQLEAIGIEKGWRCLEVGAAEGSMSRWLADRVGPQGRVVAADIDVRFLAALERDLPNVEVREADIRSAELEEASFDLAYCRTILMHVPDPADVIARIVRALVPGGLFLAEEPDMSLMIATDPDAPGADAFETSLRDLYSRLRAKKAFDTKFGRTLPRLLVSAGLEAVESRATARIHRGKDSNSETLLRTIGMMVGRGIVTSPSMATTLSLLADPAFEYMAGVQVMAWGRRPG